jgi:hypothetical protein
MMPGVNMRALCGIFVTYNLFLNLHPKIQEKTMTAFTQRNCAVSVVGIILLVLSFSASPDGIMKTKTTGAMKIELHVLPAKPLFTKEEVRSKHVKAGLLVVSGTEPIDLDANPPPNHHIAVHVFNAKTGEVIANANVSIRFQPLNDAGKPSGAACSLPVVVMQSVGKGLASTCYGNNVLMPPKTFGFMIQVNGTMTLFDVNVFDPVVDEKKSH